MMLTLLMLTLALTVMSHYATGDDDDEDMVMAKTLVASR